MAEALAKAGETSEARKAYVAVLQREPGSQCASSGLSKLNAPAAKPATKECEIGEKLLEVHRNDDAIESFKAALKSDPEDDCATDGLTDAGPSTATRTLDDVTNSIPNVLVGLGLLILAFFLILMLAYWPWLGRGLRRLKPIDLILKPRLTFDDVGDKAVEGEPGAATAARIKERLTRMRDEATKEELHEYELDLGSPREEFADLVGGDTSLKGSLEKASDISDQTKIVAAALNVVYALLPVPRFEIATTLEPPTTSGAAATLLLQRNSKMQAATTLHGPAPENHDTVAGASEYVELADPAAVWVQFEIARVLKGEPPNASQAQSHALVLEGLELYFEDKYDEALGSFEKARQFDSRNWAALVCISLVEARGKEDLERSIKRLTEGLKGMRSAPSA